MKFLVPAIDFICILILGLAVSCSGPLVLSDTAVPSGTPEAATIDGRILSKDAPNTVNSHVYFLPPLVAMKDTAHGSADVSLSPEVLITRDGAEIARFRSGPDSGRDFVRLSADDQQYMVNWHAGRSDLVAGYRYRISILVHGFEIASRDIVVRDQGAGRMSIGESGNEFKLAGNRTVPIRFRIEAGAFVPVTGVSLIREGTSELTAIITPADATIQSVVWSSSDPAVVALTPDAQNPLRCHVDGLGLGSSRIEVATLDGGFTSIAQAESLQQIVRWGAATTAYPNNGRISAISVGHRLDAGSEYGLALTDSGQIAAWGSDQYGQVSGVPGGMVRKSDAFYSLRTDFTRIAAGGMFAAAITREGGIVQWGKVPVNAPGGNDFVDLAGGDSHMLALTESGQIVAWGNDANGECSEIPGGALSGDGLVFASVSSDFVSIAAGEKWSLAVRRDGSIAVWGAGTPPGEQGFLTVSTVVSGGNLAVALRTDGSLFSWYVSGGAVVYSAPGSDYASVAAGVYPVLALTKDGQVVAWGTDIAGACSGIPGGAVPQSGAYFSVERNFLAVAAGVETSYAVRKSLELIVQ